MRPPGYSQCRFFSFYCDRRRACIWLEVPVKLYVQGLLKQAKAMARPMACFIHPNKRIRALQGMADALVDQSSNILAANEKEIFN